jgi:Flp pilus assembly protein TadG
MLSLRLAVPGARSAGTDNGRRQTRLASERGQALLETAITLPLVLLVSVSIFEFGRAYQTSQVITNAAREGARVAVLPSTTNEDVQARVTAYLRSGQLGNADRATVSVSRTATISIGASTASASTVTVNYPFSFMVLNPVANLVTRGPSLGSPIMLTASAQMRNEAQ